MKKNLPVFIFFSCLLLTLTSCKTTDKDPKAVAEAFTTSFLKRDYDGAAKYASLESRKGLEMLKSADEMAKRFSQKQEDSEFARELKGKKIAYSEPQLEGTDRATVMILADGKNYMPLTLTVEDKAWKVAFDKATIMDTERNNSR